ncbi:basic salivary proline-rich protein 2-like [Nerophis ophidion]|uniref:basic salivary proline-rich protein 2-like n=1 Tax=Nerophis ophidion TaxID=159077 RepID=UPI002AE0AEAA|nr:basic salivary proline-rich protein 2-like [Nerophis ophidion]
METSPRQPASQPKRQHANNRHQHPPPPIDPTTPTQTRTNTPPPKQPRYSIQTRQRGRAATASSHQHRLHSARRQPGTKARRPPPSPTARDLHQTSLRGHHESPPPAKQSQHPPTPTQPSRAHTATCPYESRPGDGAPQWKKKPMHPVRTSAFKPAGNPTPAITHNPTGAQTPITVPQPLQPNTPMPTAGSTTATITTTARSHQANRATVHPPRTTKHPNAPPTTPSVTAPYRLRQRRGMPPGGEQHAAAQERGGNVPQPSAQ